MTHTQGPWRVADRTTKTKGYLILGGYNREVANVWRRPDYMPEEQSTDDANARLIAAAPELLEALKELEAALRKDSRDKSIARDTVEYHLDGQAMYLAINRARAAIAKAEGREP